MWSSADGMDSSASGQWSVGYVIGLFSAALVTLYLALHTFHWTSEDGAEGRISRSSRRLRRRRVSAPPPPQHDPSATPRIASISGRRRAKSYDVEEADHERTTTVAKIVSDSEGSGIVGTTSPSGSTPEDDKAAPVKRPEAVASWWRTVALGCPFVDNKSPFLLMPWQLFPSESRRRDVTDHTLSRQASLHNTAASAEPTQRRMHASCLDISPSSEEQRAWSENPTDDTGFAFVSGTVPSSGRVGSECGQRSTAVTSFAAHLRSSKRSIQLSESKPDTSSASECDSTPAFIPSSHLPSGREASLPHVPLEPASATPVPAPLSSLESVADMASDSGYEQDTVEEEDPLLDASDNNPADLDSILAVLKAVELWDMPPSEDGEDMAVVVDRKDGEDVSGRLTPERDDLFAQNERFTTSTPTVADQPEHCHSRLNSMLIRDKERRARLSYLDQMTCGEVGGGSSGVQRATDETNVSFLSSANDLSNYLEEFSFLTDLSRIKGEEGEVVGKVLLVNSRSDDRKDEELISLGEGVSLESEQRAPLATNSSPYGDECLPFESKICRGPSAVSGIDPPLSPSEHLRCEPGEAQKVVPSGGDLDKLLELMSSMNTTESPFKRSKFETEEVVTREEEEEEQPCTFSQRQTSSSSSSSPRSSSSSEARDPNIAELEEQKRQSRNSSSGDEADASPSSRAHEERSSPEIAEEAPSAAAVNASGSEEVAWTAHSCPAKPIYAFDGADMEQQQHPLGATSSTPTSNGDPMGSVVSPTGVNKTKYLRFKPEPDVFDLVAESGSEEDLSRSHRHERTWRHANGVMRGNVTVARPGILHHHHHHSPNRKSSSKYQIFSSLKLTQSDLENPELVIPPVQVERQVLPVRTAFVTPDTKMARFSGQSSPDGFANARPFPREKEPPICVTVREMDLPSPVHDARRDAALTVERINNCPPEHPPKVQPPSPTRSSPASTPPPRAQPTPTVYLEHPMSRLEGAVPRQSTNVGQRQQDAIPNRTTHTPVRTSPVISAAVASTQPYHLPRRPQRFVPDPESIERITGYNAAAAMAKPPLPPSSRVHSTNRSVIGGSRNRVLNARRQYFDHKISASSQNLERYRFEEFMRRAQEARTRMATSTPDLAAMEAAVRKVRDDYKPPEQSKGKPIRSREVHIREHQPVQCTIDDIWATYVRRLQQDLNRRSRSMGYLETDIDTITPPAPMISDNKDTARCSSLLTLESLPKTLPEQTRSRSVDFLSEEPMGEESGMRSEHEMRVERSLHNLTLPDWYVQSPWSRRPKQGFLLTPRSERPSGWQGIRSLNSSTCSLATDPGRSTLDGHRPSRTDWRHVGSLRSSHEHLLWGKGSTSPRADNVSFPRWDRCNQGPALSLALHRAFREPYLGWRAARTPSRGVSPQPDYLSRHCHTDGSATPSDDIISDPLSFSDIDMPVEHGVHQVADRSVLEDIMETTSPESARRVQVNAITGCPSPPQNYPPSQSVPVLKNGDVQEQTRKPRTKDQLLSSKRDRYSYVQSIYHSEMDIFNPHAKSPPPPQQELSTSSPPQVIWIESSFVGARTTTSVVVFPNNKSGSERSCHRNVDDDADERPASR